MSLIERFKLLFGFTADQGQAPVHSGVTPVIFTDVYLDGPDRWFFSWYKSDHSDGEVRGPFTDRAIALLDRDRWQLKRPKGYQYVHQESR